MKRHCFTSYPLFALIGLILSPLAVVHASPSTADSVHFCLPFDYEQWQRDHPLPAGKRLADRNVGEPRTVRMIYFLPNDLPYRQEEVELLKRVVKQTQTFYAEQMQAHGYGRRTFRFETDAQDEPLVHRVDGQHSFRHYRDESVKGYLPIYDEILQTFDFTTNIYLIAHVMDKNTDRGGGSGIRQSKDGGFGTGVFKRGYSTQEHFFRLFGHELGHAFGLQHDFRLGQYPNDNAYLMSYGEPKRISSCNARHLAVHPYFNADIPIAEAQPPTIELTSSLVIPEGVTSIPVRIKIRDSDGLHQVLLYVNTYATYPELKECHGLDGEKEAVVEFDYDGIFPSSKDLGMSFDSFKTQNLIIEAIDALGNTVWESFELVNAREFRQPDATLGHQDWQDGINSLSFSPDGKLLASGGGSEIVDGRVKLWDVSSGETVATLTANEKGVYSVSFSPDGKLLASGGSFDDPVIKLWDVSTRETVATLRHEGSGVYPLSFSPDGKLLASGGSDKPLLVMLWDVSSGETVARLSGHWSTIISVSFSPDGRLLASGGAYGTVKLWDVSSGETVATLGHEGDVSSVSFSPDGKLLASGGRRNNPVVTLWDVSTRETVATLSGSGPVSFSPDGKLLASGSGAAAEAQTIKLWDVGGQNVIAILDAHREANAVSFSPDGRLLAASPGNGTIILWDVSEWAGSSEPKTPTVEQMPYTLAKVSGDGQEGTVGEPLAKPFIVSVLDQEGSAFAGAVVSFSVTAGGGTLSATTATTDANGRARSTLTLGSDPGTNTVVATVAGLGTVTFTATATEQTAHSLTKVSGDNQEGPASTQLAEPLVVSVLDQDGSPLAGVDVTFAVIAGGGKLSSTTDTNPCTIKLSTSSITASTDANGQAATRLTLGSEPGTNTVEATVAGLESVTFTATAAEQASPHSLTKVCGDDQEGTAGGQLAAPFVVLVSAEDGAAMAGVDVSFAVTAGEGTLSATTATTNANGRAMTWLTLGSEPGTNTVTATVEGLAAVTFTATGEEDPLLGILGSLLGSGKRASLPDRTQLLQNAPNPFNSQTVLSYFLLEPGPARLEVFSLTGQRVAVLHQGPQQAGYHRLHWDGRDAAGHPVASGMYLYRLMTDEAALTRKLILLR